MHVSPCVFTTPPPSPAMLAFSVRSYFSYLLITGAGAAYGFYFSFIELNQSMLIVIRENLTNSELLVLCVEWKILNVSFFLNFVTHQRCFCRVHI